MAASTAAALNGTLFVAAVFLVLLQSSMGRKPGPPHHCPDDNAGQQPAAPAHHCRDDDSDEQPAPTPAPAAALTATPTPPPTPAPSAAPPTTTPTPAPAPAADCYLNCSKQCSPLCQANMTAGASKCQADAIAGGNSCYDSCTTNTCPDKCVNSGCSFDSCTCDNTYARSCCDACARAINPTYFSCVNYYGRAVQYCMINCQDDCNKKCTQG
ncbi:hypothetical protein SEVIR_3G309200v4 [Setaria viridis]|uniref:Uncharacterized protein n=1 Tax=Setaria viridis TaxID=4556 RepID=A0A4U6VU24_SETVI|nr:hypothetical protein SEVIR_3G309200v2 [Setaria viridis]